MSEFAWAAAAPQEVGALPVSAPALPPLLDPEEPGAPAVPVVPPTAEGAGEQLVALAHPRLLDVAAYRVQGFPSTVGGAYLRQGAAERVVDVAEALPEPFGLAVFDAWRDPQLQTFLYHRAYDGHPELPPGFVSPPSMDPGTPPPHATGGTVDLTLTWEGFPLALGTDFDEFDERAFAASLEGVGGGADTLARDLRRMLRAAMAHAGFVVLAREWWHFEFGTRLWAAVRGVEPRYGRAARPVGE